MPLTLHNLKLNKKSRKSKKRVGRGNSSGHGTYSTRGLKGQRSRSGGKKGLKRLGLRPVILATPKKKGFKSLRPQNQVVNIANLNKLKEGAIVNSETLFKAKLIDDIKAPIKILGNGELKRKNLTINKNIKISRQAKKKIEDLGGKIEAMVKKIRKAPKASAKKDKSQKDKTVSKK